jgi:hypothetical protein
MGAQAYQRQALATSNEHFGPASVIESYRSSRDELSALWDGKWSEDLPCAAPKNRGRIQKAGSPGQSHTIKLSIPDAEQYVLNKLPIYMGCQVCPESPVVEHHSISRILWNG